MTIIDELRELERKATQGEWRVNYFASHRVVADTPNPGFVSSIASTDESVRADEDAALIIAMRNNLSALLRCVEAAKAMRDRVDQPQWIALNDALAALEAVGGEKGMADE
jgi:uncharacterized alpha-E superfamily protein